MNHRFALPSLLVLILASLSSPAHATGVPAVDLAGRHVESSLGLPNVSVDVPLFDGFSLGAHMGWALFAGETDWRANYRLGGSDDGLTYGVGLVYRHAWVASYSGWVGDYIQPALTLAYPLLPSLKFRAIVGPCIGLNEHLGSVYLSSFMGPASNDPITFALSSLELAWQVGPQVELTTGGQSFFGARFIY